MAVLVLDELPDALLVSRSRAGDAESFAGLVRRHTPALLGHARAVLGAGSEAEDLVQEAFLRAWRALPREERVRSFAAWVHAILHRACLDVLRARRDLRSLEESGEELPGEEPLPPLDRPDGLDAAIAALPARQRAVLHCRYALGLDAAETAERLETTPGNVRVALHRALSALRRRFA